MINRRHFLLNYVFLIGIILLFLNDHFFKYEFSNWFTGKLSDFVGLLIFPFFLSFIFPNRIKLNVIFTGVFFVFWKSPYSQGLIELYNSITLIKITRVVDYSDYIALVVLPISYYVLKHTQILKKFYLNKVKVHPIIILVPALVVFMATSPPYWHSFIYSEGNIKFYKTTVDIKKSQQEILNEMESINIPVAIDTTKSTRYSEKINYYIIDELVLDKDTIKDLRFAMVSFKENKTKIFLNALTISEEIEDIEVKGKLRKYYKKLLRKYIKKSLK